MARAVSRVVSGSVTLLALFAPDPDAAQRLKDLPFTRLPPLR